MKAQQAEENRRKMVWQNAMYDASLQNGFLRISWDTIEVINPILYDFKVSFGMDLRALRLVGIGLHSVPPEVADQLPMLEVLSLANNHLTSIPENIVQLAHLRELNLMYNNIRELPERIGLMCSLERLGITNNQLKALPRTLGGLVLLRRLDLEQNCLQFLPENLNNMTSCEVVNVNYNELRRLPRALSRMPSLTQISACGNHIEYIPLEIAASSTIKCIRLSKNKIRMIPERLGDMQQLEELCLEFNPFIHRLPLSFWKLSNLRVLRLEGNIDLRDPPPTILNAGAAAVIKYCTDAYMNDKLSRMRHIVLSTQNVLQQLRRRNMGDPALFNADVRLVDNDEDRWCGMQMDYFWQKLLPEIQQVWKFERNFATRNTNDEITSFEFNQQEVLSAFSNYFDAVGPVLKRQKAMFRRCACTLEDTSTGLMTRNPCVPPKVGFMCYRECILLKMNCVRESERKDRLWKAYKAGSLSDAMKRADYEARLFLNSHEGQIWVEEFAYQQAEEFLVESGAVEIVERRHRRAEERKKLIISRFEAQKKKLTKVRDKKIKALTDELENLKQDKQKLHGQDSYVLSAIEQRIQNLTVRIARLPENVELAELRERCEQECRDCDAGLFDDEDDNSTNTSQLDSSEYSSEDDSAEAQRFRRRLMRRDELMRMRTDRLYRQANTLDKVQMRRSNGEEDSDTDKNNNNSAAVKQQDGINTNNSKIGMKDQVLGRVRNARRFADNRLYRPFLEPVSFHTRRHYARMKKTVKRRLRVIAEVSRMRVRKVYLQANGQFDELQKELKYEIFVQYINHHVNLAREKARNDFNVIETVRHSMEGAGKERTFKAWKKWVWTKQKRIRRDLRQRWKMATRGFDAAMESVNSAQYQVDLWEKLVDIYTDRIFWQHKVTKKITYDHPGIEHYLPPNFQIPVPPEDLPPDIPLETSSDDDSNDDIWMEKYAERRRQRAEQQQLLQLALRGDLSSTSESDGDFSDSPKNLEHGNTKDRNCDGPIPNSIDDNRHIRSRYKDVQNALVTAEQLKERGVTSHSLDDKLSYMEAELHEPLVTNSTTESISIGSSLSDALLESKVNAVCTNDLLSHLRNSEKTYEEQENFQSSLEFPLHDSNPFQSSLNFSQSHGEIVSTPHDYESYEYSVNSKDERHHNVELSFTKNSLSTGEIAYRRRMDRLMRRRDGFDSSDEDDADDNASLMFHQETQNIESTSNLDKNKSENLAIREHAMYRQRNAKEVYVGEQQSHLTLQLQQSVEIAKDYMKNNELYRKRNLMMTKALMTKRGIAAGFTGINMIDQQLIEQDLQKEGESEQSSSKLLVSHNSEQLGVLKEVVAGRSINEYEVAAKAIRKKRNQLNPQRHHTYMNQMNRQPKSLEQSLIEQGSSDHIVDLGDGFKLSKSEIDQLTALADGKESTAKIPVDLLLRLAGGNKEMIHNTGKDGIELRTVLAQRALHVKKKLQSQAADRKIRAPKKDSLYRRELRPLFMSRYKGSSSEEEEEDAELQRKKGKAARRALRLASKTDRAFMVDKVTGTEHKSFPPSK